METLLGKELAAMVIGCLAAGGVARAPLQDNFKTGALCGITALTAFIMGRLAGLV